MTKLAWSVPSSLCFAFRVSVYIFAAVLAFGPGASASPLIALNTGSPIVKMGYMTMSGPPVNPETCPACSPDPISIIDRFGFQDALGQEARVLMQFDLISFKSYPDTWPIKANLSFYLGQGNADTADIKIIAFMGDQVLLPVWDGNPLDVRDWLYTVHKGANTLDVSYLVREAFLQGITSPYLDLLMLTMPDSTMPPYGIGGVDLYTDAIADGVFPPKPGTDADSARVRLDLSIPEPISLVVFGTTLAGLWFLRRRLHRR